MAIRPRLAIRVFDPFNEANVKLEAGFAFVLGEYLIGIAAE